MANSLFSTLNGEILLDLFMTIARDKHHAHEIHCAAIQKWIDALENVSAIKSHPLLKDASSGARFAAHYKLLVLLAREKQDYSALAA